ncbi:MAG: anion transporter [Kiritimatiellaeota bacterium]|nr:anion transporter [Kiritimatiellota bacterium]
MHLIPEQWMGLVATGIFMATYIGIAIGCVPRLALDRTGIALLGAIAMVATGALSMPQALQALDAPTLLLLYALMVVSAQFRIGGFYTWTVLQLRRFMPREKLFLLLVMAVTAVMSAVLVNDVICLAFTPVLAVALLQVGLNPVPFLIGMAMASNIGSAATIIGNPQNMLIGQMGHLAFGPFLAWCSVPSLISLALAYGTIVWLYRGRFQGTVPAHIGAACWPPFNRRQSIKGLLATGALIILFFTHIPRELTALSIAGLLLCSRQMRTRDMLEQVDWHLLTLFCGLFIVIGGFMLTGLPAALVADLKGCGIDLNNLYVLTGLSALLSNVVSNVPATMLMIQFLDPVRVTEWYVLALASTYAGNLITIGSIANLITIEQARHYGIAIGFKEHARVGIPVTALSLLVTLAWIWLRTNHG